MSLQSPLQIQELPCLLYTSIRAVKLIVAKMADAVIEAKQGEVLEGSREIEVPADFVAENAEA